MNIKNLLLLVLMIAIFSALYLSSDTLWKPVTKKILGKKTTSDIIKLYGKNARDQLNPYFTKAKITYPPAKVTFLAMKEEKELELWAKNDTNTYTFIRSYNIKKLSGNEGPKLREGDRQVPEGHYKIIGFNPNSAFHLSMKLNYPNKFDLLHANQEERTQPGTNIFIHGKSVSLGCLAMGDNTIEELFVLSKDVGISNIDVVISPYDPRIKGLKYNKKQPIWVEQLYLDIENTYRRYQ